MKNLLRIANTNSGVQIFFLHGENLLTKHYPKVDKNGGIETFGENLK